MRLKQYLMVEQKLNMIVSAISRSEEGKETVMILILQAIPCVMHLENNVGKKLIMVFLAMGAERFHQEKGVRSLKQFARNVNHIVNTRILGTVSHPKKWKVPINDSSDSVVKVSLSNKKHAPLLIILIFLLNRFSLPQKMKSASVSGRSCFKITGKQ